jgi:tRNA 2-thiouridine synthesizing protein A
MWFLFLLMRFQKSGMSDFAKVVPDEVVNAKNLLCPLPILRADAAIRKMQVGQVLEVQSTDPGLNNDLPAWCGVNGHKMLGIRQEGRVVIGLVKKGE